VYVPFLSFRVSTAEPSDAVDADFAVHRYTPRSEETHGTIYQLGTEVYSLPEQLAPFVGHINPGNDFRTSLLPLSHSSCPSKVL
jgi:hypothetical protein